MSDGRRVISKEQRAILSGLALGGQLIRSWNGDYRLCMHGGHERVSVHLMKRMLAAGYISQVKRRDVAYARYEITAIGREALRNI